MDKDQWWQVAAGQDLDLGQDQKTKLKPKWIWKILIDINNKLNKQLYGNIIFIHKLN